MRMIMVMMLNIPGVLLLVTITWYWCWFVAAAYVDMPVGRGRPGTAVGSVTATLPPHRTGWGYEYEYDNGRGGRSPPLADTSKCSAERAIQMFNRLRWLRLQVAPEDKPEGRATVCGTIGSSPPSWRMPTLASGNAATPEFRQTPYRDPAS